MPHSGDLFEKVEYRDDTTGAKESMKRHKGLLKIINNDKNNPNFYQKGGRYSCFIDFYIYDFVLY